MFLYKGKELTLTEAPVRLKYRALERRLLNEDAYLAKSLLF